MLSDRPDPYNLYLMLKELHKKLGPSEFGRVCQVMLGLAFRHLHFSVPICQLSGRPDIRAQKGREKYEIETKATVGQHVTIKTEDLKGVRVSGYHRVVAVLTYPSPESVWLTLNADELKPGRFLKSDLNEYSLSSLEKKVNKIFSTVTKQHLESALEGSSALKAFLG